MKIFRHFSALMGLVFSAVLALQLIHAVDWPQPISSVTDLSTTFARPRDSVFSTGIVFSQEGTVKTSDSGQILITMNESESITQFDSPLGKALIMINTENLLSTYGNLKTIHISPAVNTLNAGTVIGESGESGWQSSPSGLEYQVADIESSTVINPQILLPKKTGIAAPVLRNFTAVSKNGNTFLLSNVDYIPAGTYSLYCEQLDMYAPFKTTVLLNGKEAETISYSTLKKDGNRLTANGNRNYSFDFIFPDSKRQLLATLLLNKGKALIVIQAYDINGTEKTALYSLDVY